MVHVMFSDLVVVDGLISHDIDIDIETDVERRKKKENTVRTGVFNVEKKR